MNIFKWKLHWQILTALGLAVLLATLVQGGSLEGTAFTNGLLATCAFLGELFMNALRMIVVPLIVSSIITGVMSLGAESHFGRMSLKVIIYYSISGILAICLGILLVNVIQPGNVDADTAQAILGQQETSEEFQQRFVGRGGGDMVEIFLRMVPPNIFEAATDNGQLLGLISFSLLFGFFISRLPEKLRSFQESLWESFQRVMTMITDLIICFAPIGVFGLVTPILIRTGFDALAPLFWFFVTVMLGLLLHTFVSLSLLLKYVGKVSPLAHIRAMVSVLLTAFSTASSASTLPVTLDCVRETGVSNKTASFSLPLGATVNMDGTALYECVVVIFISQFYSALPGFETFEFGIVQQFTVVVLALMTSIGVAGIPSASLVAITVILGVVGLPIEAIGLIWVTDRVLDMCRTATNVYSDTCGAVIISRTEGEKIYGEAETAS